MQPPSATSRSRAVYRESTAQVVAGHTPTNVSTSPKRVGQLVNIKQYKHKNKIKRRRREVSAEDGEETDEQTAPSNAVQVANKKHVIFKLKYE